jgi:flagella basal body P-ring formation protein FlgA
MAVVCAQAPATDGLDSVREAITVAVQQRFGTAAPATVVLGDLQADVTAAPGLVAVPDPGARTGRLVQFTLRSGTRRVGTAVATVTVSAPHVKAVAPLTRDASIVADAVAAVDGEVPDVRFEPLPQLDDVVGAQARRAVAPGELLSHAVVIVPDAVRAGDEVKVVARLGALEAWGVGRASGSGRVGDVVRITRRGAPGLQRARVLSAGVVQVLLEQSQEIR